MTFIQGIDFDDKAAVLVQKLIDEVKAVGDSTEYGLTRLGELRIAHEGPSGTRKKAKGVFVQIAPSSKGATVIRRINHKEGAQRTVLTEANLSELTGHVKSWRLQSGKALRSNVKEAPEQPGTVSGGRPESNPRKF